jgi:hypothetical protein
MLGILSQAVGLFQMMNVVEQMGGVSPALLAGGLKVSMLAPIYGASIFVAAILLRLAIGWLPSRSGA